MQNFFDSVRSRKPVVEDTVFGNNTALPATWQTLPIPEKHCALGWGRQRDPKLPGDVPRQPHGDEKFCPEKPTRVKNPCIYQGQK